MSFIVIAKTPAGGAWLESEHTSRDAAENEAARLNRLTLPFSFIVVERSAS